MIDERNLILTGDPAPRAGYCGGCGEFVGPLHSCQPTGDGKVRVPLKRCCLAVLEGEDCDCAEFVAGTRWEQ